MLDEWGKEGVCLIGWLKGPKIMRVVRKGGRESIGRLNRLSNLRYWIEGGRESIGWLKLPKVRWVILLCKKLSGLFIQWKVRCVTKGEREGTAFLK